MKLIFQVADDSEAAAAQLEAMVSALSHLLHWTDSFEQLFKMFYLLEGLLSGDVIMFYPLQGHLRWKGTQFITFSSLRGHLKATFIPYSATMLDNYGPNQPYSIVGRWLRCRK